MSILGGGTRQARQLENKNKNNNNNNKNRIYIYSLLFM